ncbi:MAG: hypothetical protein HYS26_01850 [Candidatus Kaiserbacteria bacterium]|nr:MAG: hypothetical protein HYS26_01850 [Candidatus Kaiserbacteria bacterium]
MKLFFVGVLAFIALAVASIFLLPKPDGSNLSQDPDILATNGMHWHPQLSIFVKGEQIEIPQNIGIGSVHQTMHTHDDLPLLHLEFPALVRQADATLGRFFSIWGKDMRSLGANMRMTVNGQVSTEYENYVMHDGDKIELHYD